MIELSKLNPMWEVDEVVNFVFDNGYIGVVNDMMENPTNLYYDAEDLYEFWNELKKLLEKESEELFCEYSGLPSPKAYDTDQI